MEKKLTCLESGNGMNRCAREVHDWHVHGTGPLYGAFAGWRIAGDELVSPNGDRMRARRLEWLMREEWQQRRGKKKKGKGVVVELRPSASGCTRAARSTLPAPPRASALGRDPVGLAGAMRPPLLSD